MPFIKMMDKQYLEDEAKASDKSDDDDIDFDDLPLTTCRPATLTVRPSFDNPVGIQEYEVKIMKIIMIYDQIQSGLGTKDDTMVPLQAKGAYWSRSYDGALLKGGGRPCDSLPVLRQRNLLS